MSKHTPGPWVSIRYLDSRFYELGSNEFHARLAFTHGEGDTDEANMRLIAAAPDLLEALENLADYIDERAGDNECRPLENARAAIAKAKGEA